MLNGTKSWISNGGEAGLYLVYARHQPGRAAERGASPRSWCPADTPGLRAGEKEKKLGIRASSTTQIFFEDCRVPTDAVLGTVDEGFRIAMATLDGGRIGIGAQALGIAQRALDESVRYTKEREAFGHPIADFQGLQWRMADMATRIEAARLLVYRAARMKDAGPAVCEEASMAKLFASETAMFCAHAAVQIFGGYGFTRDYPVEKLFRDAKITEIYEGTSEIQRLVISRHVSAGDWLTPVAGGRGPDARLLRRRQRQDDGRVRGGAARRRAVGWKVLMIQYTKMGEWPKGEPMGEINGARRLAPDFEVISTGIGFVNILGDTYTLAEHRDAAQQGLELYRSEPPRANTS